MLSRNRKTFAESSLVLNLFASQIGEFFLSHPVSYNVSGMNYIKENMHSEGEGHVVTFLAYFPFW